MQKKALTNQDYLIKFAKLNEIEQIIIIQEALNVNETVAKTYLDLILKTIKKKQFLFTLFNRKQDLDQIQSLLQKIDKEKLEKIKRKNKTQETRLQIKIKTSIFEIDQLRKSGVGWQRITNYLAKERKIKASSKSVSRYYKKYEYLIR